MDIAVLGGGPGAYATAADLALAGHAVRLWRRAETGLQPVREAGGIALVADNRRRPAKLARVTADLGEALDGAEIVIASLPAPAHEDLARRLAPYLGERHIVLLVPGTFGSYVLAREIARAGGRLPYAIAETGTFPYLARTIGPAGVEILRRAADLPTGVFPAVRAAPVLAKLAALYGTVRPCVDALDAALTNPGPVAHPPLVLLNAGAIDEGRFDVHAAPVPASAERLVEAVDAERIATRRGLGYPPPHDGLTAACAEGGEPLTFEHRYVVEDVALGLPLFESAARTAGAESPAISGLLLVFGVLLGRPLSGRGRALEHLGLGDLLRREIRALLAEGWASPLWNRVIK